MNYYVPIDITRKMHSMSNYYETYSPKNRRNVRLFNELEYKNFLTIEMNPDIVRFCEKPFIIQIEINGSIKEIIPDFWIQYKNGKEEIQQIESTKSLNMNDTAQNKAVIKELKIQQWCITNNFNYKLREVKDINISMFYLNNLRYLFGLVKRLDSPMSGKYLTILKSKLYGDRVKIIDLFLNKVVPVEALFSTIALGIYNGDLEASIVKEVINFNTEVWIRREM